MEGDKEAGSQEGRSYWVNQVGAAATKLRTVAPDLTTAKRACAASYGYACRASGAVKGAINVPSEASRTRIGSWAPDPQSQEVIMKAVTSAAADEALKAVSSFVPGGDPLYRITKVGARELSKAYSKKGAEEPQKKDSASSEDLSGSSSLEAIEKKLQEMSSEMNELKLQNQMVREKIGGLSPGDEWKPSLQLSSPSQQLPLLAPVAAPKWQKPEDVIRAFVTKGLKGRDLQSALLIPKFSGTGNDCVGNETKP